MISLYRRKGNRKSEQKPTLLFVDFYKSMIFRLRFENKNDRRFDPAAGFVLNFASERVFFSSPQAIIIRFPFFSRVPRGKNTLRRAMRAAHRGEEETQSVFDGDNRGPRKTVFCGGKNARNRVKTKFSLASEVLRPLPLRANGRTKKCANRLRRRCGIPSRARCG